MPVVPSSYRPPRGLANGHVQTLFPALFRGVPTVTHRRERIDTPDGDFLDLDWSSPTGSDRIVILSHGLEGESRNACIQGMAAAFHRAGWDALAWNLRGCSNEPNRLLRSYHSGATEDLACVIAHVPARYRTLALVGFSLGGNLTLKYLGEEPGTIDQRIGGAVAFSVPCDLASSALTLESPMNGIYMRHFLRTLEKKIHRKAAAFPGQMDPGAIRGMSTFREFDGTFTAPMNGFSSAEDYWQRASSRQFLPRIPVPTLLVNALNDPFLPTECFPFPEAEASRTLHLETPRSGGHVGFISFNARNEYWSESRAVEFIAAC